MVNLRRLSKYFLAYIIFFIVSAAIMSSSVIRPIDFAVYQKYYLHSEIDKQIDKYSNQIKEKIVFVNIPDKGANGTYFDIKYLRGEIARLLDTIDAFAELNKKPRAVIIDASFSRDTIMLGRMEESIMKIAEQQIKVYAAYEMPSENDQTSYERHDALQLQDLYNYYFGRLNNVFNDHIEANGIASYNSFELIGDRPIESLPVKVVNDFLGDTTNLKAPIKYQLPLKLPFSYASVKENSYEFTIDQPLSGIHNFSTLNPSLNLSNKFIIIGLPSDIVYIGEHQFPGPYLVASAIVDQINGNEFTKPSHGNIAVQLSMVLIFALFVCIIFAVLYKYVKKLQTKPHFISVLSFLIGLLLLMGLGIAFLEYTIIRPGLPILSMIWASLLAWHFTKKFLVTGIMEGGEIYDVFISYSHGDSAWVKQNLFNPLNEFKKPDGSKLNIFFDEKSIGIGELFTTKYMRSIVDSKLFVPVMSEEYYRKNHCRNEMDLAVKRKIENLISMCIIALDYKFVPEEFTNINFVDITKQTDFITTLKKEIIKDDQKQVEESHLLESDDLDVQESKHTVKKKKDKQQSKKKGKKVEKKKPKKEKGEKKKSDKKDKTKKSKKRSEKKNKKEVKQNNKSEKKKSKKQVKKRNKKDKKYKNKKH